MRLDIATIATYIATIKKGGRACNLYNYDFEKQRNERNLLLLFTKVY